MRDPQDQITAFWQSCASEYGRQPRHGILDPREIDAWIDALKPLLPPPPADVLDLGTGSGTMAMIYARMGHRVRGIDLVPEMIDDAHRLCAGMTDPPGFELGDARDPSGEPASVDVISNRHVFWTLIDPKDALTNWIRLLRSGGRILIIDGLWFKDQRDDANDERSQHMRKYYTDAVKARLPVVDSTSVDEIVGLVERSGFRDVTVSDLRNVERLEDELHGAEQHSQPRYVLQAFKP